MIKEEKNLLFSVYRDANVWSKAGVEGPALGQKRQKRFLYVIILIQI